MPDNNSKENMEGRLEKEWAKEEAAHKQAADQAWAAVICALREPKLWAVQMAEVVIWAIKMVAAVFAIGIALLLAIKLAVPELLGPVIRQFSIICGASLVLLCVPFFRWLRPVSPFMDVWNAKYRECRASIDAIRNSPRKL